MMMPAKAFSIVVWALVMASLLAPLGFGKVLGKRKQITRERKVAARAASATERAETTAHSIEDATIKKLEAGPAEEDVEEHTPLNNQT